jgi:hypothetical protein
MPRPIRISLVVDRVGSKVTPDLMYSSSWAATVLAGKRLGIRGVIHGECWLEADTPRAEPWRRDSFRRPRLSQPARRRVREEFSIDSMVRSCQEVYESLTVMALVRAAVAV